MLIKKHIDIINHVLQTTELDLIKTSELKNLLANDITNLENLWEQYCSNLVIFALFNQALNAVDLYSQERCVDNTPIRSFQAVSDKLTKAHVLSWLMKNSLEQTFRDFLTEHDDRQTIITNHLKNLSFVIELELKQNMDNILSIMGAQGYMMTNLVAKIWEIIHE